MGRNWEDLLVWKKAHELVLDIYKLTTDFPNDEKFGLVNQMKRSALSVPANIVEGHSKNSKRDFLKFLYISRGSLEELKYFLLVSKDLKFIDEKIYNIFSEKLSEISYLLNQLIKSLITSKTSTTSTNLKLTSKNNKKELT